MYNPVAEFWRSWITVAAPFVVLALPLTADPSVEKVRKGLKRLIRAGLKRQIRKGLKQVIRTIESSSESRHFAESGSGSRPRYLWKNWLFYNWQKYKNFTYVFSQTPKRTFRLQKKPSALERALQTLNAVIFLLFLRTIFACLIRNWIRVPYPNSNPLSQFWIRIQNPNPKGRYLKITQSSLRTAQKREF